MLLFAFAWSAKAEEITGFRLTICHDGDTFTETFPANGWQNIVIGGQTTSLKVLRAEVDAPESMRYIGFIATMYNAEDGWQHNENEWRTIPFTYQGNGIWAIDMGEGQELVESDWLTKNKIKTFEFFVYAEDSSGTPMHYNNESQNYKVTFTTGGGGGSDTDWKVKFYKEATATLTLLVNGMDQSYVFDGDANRLPNMQPGDAYSLVINGFYVSFICNDDVKATDVSLQYKVYEEGQDGGWNRLDAMQIFSQDVKNPEKGIIEHQTMCFADGLGQDISAGLQFGKNYVLEVMYQVIAADRYFFLGRDKESSRFRFFYDSETGISAPAEVALEENVYNLSGQRVGKDYKGITVRRGRKVLGR